MHRIRTVAVAAGALVAAVAGSALAAPTAPKPPKPPAGAARASLSAKPAIVTWGQATTFAGRITGTNGAVTVELQRDPYPLGDGWLVQKTVTTQRNGTYSVSALPTVNTSYRVAARTPAAAASTPVLVRVRPRIGLSLSTSAPAAGGRVRFYGSVRPAHDGRSVAIQKRTPSGTWTTVARATLRDAGATRSAYSRRIAIRRDGTYRVKLAAHADHLAGYSRERAIAVR